MNKRILFLGIAFIASFTTIAQTGPGGVGSSSSNVLWITPDSLVGLSNGDKIATWKDASGNANDLTQSDNIFKPEYVSSGQNGYPLARFNLDNNRLIKNSFGSFPTTEASVFIVNKNVESGDGLLSYAASTSDNEFLLYSSNNLAFYRRGNIATSGIAFNDNTWNILDLSWKASGGNTLLWKNGAQVYSTTLSNGINITTNGCLAIGAEQDGINSSYVSSQTHNGDYLEVILFNIALNTTQRIIVNNYIAAKYGFTISNDFYSFQSTHSKNVAGIGRYSATDNHLSATSSNILNISGASDLNADGEYLLFGHDGASINNWSGTGCPSNINKIEREWLLDETGNVGTVDFKISTTSLPSHTSGYTLYGIMIDSDGDFSAGADIYELTLSGSDYIVDNVDINDGDYVTIVEIKPTIEFELTIGSENESSNASVNIISNYIVSTTISVDYSTTNITATAGTDYTAASGSTATIAAGNSNTIISISITNDATAETDETFKINLSNPSSGLNIGTNNEYTHTIVDNDNTRKVSFDASSSSGSESSTTVNLGLTLSLVDNFNPTTVNYYVSGGTATNGTDYSLSSGTLTFAAGETTKNLSFTVTNDAIDENDETIYISLSSPVNCNLQAPITHIYTITDNDAAPTVSFTTSTSSASESAGTQNIGLTLSSVSAKNITVTYSLTGTATNGSDYTITSSPVTIYAGNTTKNLIASITSDDFVETNETVIITLTGATNATTTSPTVHTFTINNDDNFGYSGPGGVGKTQNLSLWVRADELSGTDGDRISSWSDISGNSHHLTQSNNLYRPAYYSNIANSYPVARFNQDYNRLIHNSYSDFPNQEITTFFVNKSNGESDDALLSYATTANNNEYLLFNSASLILYRQNATTNYGSSISNNNFNIVSSSLKTSTGATTNYKNGTLQSSTTIANTNNIVQGGCLAIGAEQDSPDGDYELIQTHTGDYTELIIYEFVVNTAQRKIIQNYLSSKYDIAVANDYYAYDSDHGTTPYYFHNVTGIGQDDASNLHDDAKGGSLVRMHTPSAMGNGEFLMWGDDNVNPQSGDFSIDWTATPPNVGNYMKRVWRADKTGDVGTVTVVVDLTGWTFETSGNIVLLIDGDDGDFENASLHTISSYSAPYATFENVSFSDGDWFTVGEEDGEGGPLPVEFLNFTAEIANKTVEISWQTASEQNADNFEIQRTADLKIWKTIGIVKAAGNSNQILSYSHVDTKPMNGVNYYRLKQNDFDGYSDYSSTIKVNFISEMPIKIYPNPGNQMIYIESDMELKSIYIYNSYGQIIKEIDAQNSMKMQISTENLACGVYLIIVRTDAGSENIKWIKEE